MNTDENCIFCKIIQKTVPSSILYEDNTVLAFLDIKPLSKGHTLVIPKNHYADIFDIPKNDLQEIYAVTKTLATAIKNATNADGISIIQQNGKAAGQVIFHYHVHIVSRFNGLSLPSFTELNIAERKELDEMAAKIKQHL
ncbi:HIT family protein [Candidatus Bathycorpusculum sp.]|uniref:HIT family protein n=1 Tax=Candidatus Bathycorpusculum sp. TaxID=2994959 RepID=UPI0028235C91|nr:HIT family protein [Candidatus Termitimicrobium sp.]MCL2684970.1 HIT family protein [Candidatus Termitimicrobium sp.]